MFPFAKEHNHLRFQHTSYFKYENYNERVRLNTINLFEVIGRIHNMHQLMLRDFKRLRRNLSPAA